MGETITATGARVWVGCLGCYNAGGLVGRWVDAAEAGDYEPHEAVNLPAGGVPPCGRLEGADERWCFDHEGFGGFLSGECSPAEAQRIAEAMAEAEADGAELAAVGEYLANTGERLTDWADVREGFEESYQGEYDSGEDYAERSFEEMGGFDVYGEAGGSDRPADLSSRWPFYCIDWERAWRELRLGDGMWTAESSGGVYVFRSI